MVISKVKSNSLKLKFKAREIIYLNEDSGSKYSETIVLDSKPESRVGLKDELGNYVISASGEYEIDDIFINSYELNNSLNYLIQGDGLNIGILHGDIKFEKKSMEEFERVDIVILSVKLGSEKELSTIVSTLSPQFVLFSVSDSAQKDEIISIYSTAKESDNNVKIDLSDISDDSDVEPVFYILS